MRTNIGRPHRTFESVAALLVMAAMTLGLGVTPSMAAQAVANAVPPRGKLADLAKDEEFRFAIGDQLRVSIFEQLQSEIASPGVPALSLVERAEFTGDYVVQATGEIFLPIIGAVKAAHLPRADVEKSLVSAAASIVGGNLRASVVVTERQPVYVTGPLPRAGSFRYTPGMLIAEAVALAGGGEDTGNMLWQKVDIARERERMRKASFHLRRLLAELAVLEGERNGSMIRVPARLLAVAGQEAPTFLKEAETARGLERSKLAAELASLDKQVVANETTLRDMRKHKEQLAGVMVERTNRYNMLNARLVQGRSTENVMAQAKSELVEIETRWHELGTGISRSEVRLVELEGEQQRLRIGAEMDVDSRIRAAKSGIEDEEVTLATVGQLLRSLGEKELETEQVLGYTYVIVRRTPSGPDQIHAELLTPLEPGDIVRVERKSAPTVASIPLH